MNTGHTGRAGGLLRSVVRLLRPDQADWAQAMQAELAALPPGRLQWGFVLGCARAVVSVRATSAPMARILLRVAVVVAVFLPAALIPVTVIRLATMLAVAALLALYGLLRSSTGFGPAASTRSVRIVAVCGLGLLAVEPVLNGPRQAAAGELVDRTDTGHALTLLIVFAVISTGYLTALVRVTARRSDVSAATVITGATLAAASGAGWLAAVLLWPALGTRTGPALAAIVAGGVVAATVAAHRAARPGPSGDDPGLITGLLACVGASLLVGTAIDLLPLTGSFVSTSAPPDHSGQAPTHLVDSVAVWLIGMIAAVALAVLIRSRSRKEAGGARKQLATAGPGA